MKHTKGEWKLSSHADIDKHNVPCIVTSGHKTVAEICFNALPIEEQFANAKLIAAAPDLLEATIELADEVAKMCSIGSDPLFMPMLKKHQAVLQAIKKATV